jgi:glutaredoxin 3
MKAIVWSKLNCPQCDNAKKLLGTSNIEFEERKIGMGYTREDLLDLVPDARSVPQIFIDDVLIGGFQELQKFLHLGD